MSDPVQWVEKHDVAVYDAHIIVDRETGQEHTVDREKLQAIADRMNQRYQSTGEESPIVVGHTRDGKPEWEQPPIVGYAHDFYVQDNPKAGHPFLYARRYKLYPKSQVGDRELTAEEVMRYYPRRSPEVWLTRNEIDPLALLGATTPMRDLGLVRNSKSADKSKHSKPLKYSIAGSNNMDYSAIVMAVEALLQQLKGGLVPEGDAEPAFDPGADPGALDAGGSGVADEAGADAPEKNEAAEFGGNDEDEGEDQDQFQYSREGPFDDDDDDDESKKYNAACASSTNDYLPGDAMNEKKKKAPEGELERVKMQRDQKVIEASKLEQRVAALEEALTKSREQATADRLKYQRDIRAGELKQMVAEGFQLDVAEEIDDVATLEEEAYQKYLGKVRKRYSRVPVGEEFIRTAPAREGGLPTNSEALKNKAVDIATRKGVDYHTALRMAQSGE